MDLKNEKIKYCKCCGKELKELVVGQKQSSLPYNKYNSETGELLKQYLRYCPEANLVPYPIIGFLATYIWENHTVISEIK